MKQACNYNADKTTLITLYLQIYIHNLYYYYYNLLLLTERYSRSVLLLEWLPWVFFPQLRLTLPTAKSSNSIIFKFLVLIQQ